MKSAKRCKVSGSTSSGEFERDLSRLMCSARDGDHGSYHSLVRTLTPFLRSKARRMGANACDIDDIVQDTLLSLHQSKASWDSSGAITSWLSTIIRNKFIDRYRRRIRSAEVVLDDFTDLLCTVESDPTDIPTTKLLLRSLDDRSRSIVESIYLEGSSAREVAGRLGMTEGAVRVAHHRIVKTLARTANRHPN